MGFGLTGHCIYVSYVLYKFLAINCVCTLYRGGVMIVSSIVEADTDVEITVLNDSLCFCV